MLKSSFSVKLMGGSSKLEGNVFARNPNTKVFGPVCDDEWTIENVSFKSCSFAQTKEFLKNCSDFLFRSFSLWGSKGVFERMGY
jgi:hypothetical protein